MAVSSVTTSPDFISALSAPLSNGDSSQSANESSGVVASIVNEIQGSAAARNPIAMLDALKQIGGSGSANIASLVNVARMATDESVDGDLVQSMGNGGESIYTALQNDYTAPDNLALYLDSQKSGGSDTSGSGSG